MSYPIFVLSLPKKFLKHIIYINSYNVDVDVNSQIPGQSQWQWKDRNQGSLLCNLGPFAHSLAPSYGSTETKMLTVTFIFF